MSLVICANQYEGTSERTSNNNQAYSFKNNLGSQMKIPKNSEIAVQSVKINKDGTVTVKPSDVFYVYQGGTIGVSGSFTDVDKSTSYPVQVQLNTGGLVEELTIDQLNSRIQTALNSGLLKTAFTGQSTVKRNTGTGVFEGFELKVNQQNASDTTNNIPNTATPYWSGFDDYFTYGVSASGEFISKGNPIQSRKDRRVGILTDSPIGNIEGKFKVSFESGSTTATSWAVGLRRSRNVNDGKKTLQRQPQYFTNTGTSLVSNQYYDYVVMAVQNEKSVGQQRYLRVFQSSIRASNTFGDDAMSRNRPINMREIVYYGAHNASMTTGPYNMSTNFSNSSFTHVEFEVLGNQLNLSIGNASSTVNLVNPTVNASSAKVNLFKPISLTTELLYPQLWLEEKDKKLTVNTWGGKLGYLFGNEKTDWWARMENQGLTNRFCKRVDTRYWADLSSVDIYPYQLPKNGAFTEKQFPPVFILTEDPVNYVNTVGANCELLLGFKGHSVIENASFVTNTYTVTSNSVPQIVSRGSAFIRLNNFTQQTFNAGKGALSKIIYHIPRFDNSGNQTGSDLFFEPTEKTYVALNNVNELNVNSFDIDVVSEEETFATDLVGKTIVVLHIREKK